MSRPVWPIFGLLLCGVFVCAVLAADEQSLAPQDGLLLLRTGGVLAGRITRAGDRYFVAVPDGEVRLKVSEVELVCRDLEDGYRKKRAGIAANRPEDHIDLGEWCLKQGLLEHAKQELADATKLDPRSPRVQMLHQRVEQALQQQSATPAQSEPQDAVSNDDLDRLVRGMPPKTVETFTQTIQPLLLNSCATAGCHGPRAENHFQLIRNVSGKAASRRLTQRNLQTTLQYVDMKNPADSLLLTLPTKAHGTAAAAIFTNQQSGQYAQLVDWVASVTGQDTGIATAVLEEAAAIGAPTQPAPIAESPDSATVHAPLAPTLVAPRATEKPHGPKPPQVGPASKATEKSVKPAAPDPFDPEAFNRRFFPQ